MLKKFVIGAVAAGTVAVGAVGTADAVSGNAAPVTTSPASAVVAANPATGSVPSTGTKRQHTFSCSNGPKVLQRIATVEAHISAGLPKLHAAEQRATQNGKTKRAAKIERLITRLESSKFQTRLQRVTQRIEQTCHISAPTGSTGTGSTGTGSTGTGSTASA